MISTPPQVALDGRYGQKETAQILQINPSTLFRHTRQRKIKCGYRRTNHRPFYTGQEILRYWKSEL